MDPLAEKYYPISPYAYCSGNPVNLVDPEGLYIRAISNDDIEVFKNMLSEDELQFIAFDDNGLLNNNLISSYSGESVLLNTIKTLAQSDLFYIFTISDNDGEKPFYERGDMGDNESFYYGLTRFPGDYEEASPDDNVYVFTASFLNSRERARNLGHELLGHGYFYELSRKDATINPFHSTKNKEGDVIYDEECGLWVTKVIFEKDPDAPLEKWIKRIEEQICKNYDNRH